MTINYPRGRMVIRLDEFFPTSQARFKKLLKIMEMDNDFEQNLIVLEQFFEEKLEKLKESKVSFAKSYWKYNQDVADITEQVKSKKFPNGVSMTKLQVDQSKKALSDAKNLRKDYKLLFNAAERDIQGIKKNMEFLQQRK